MGGAAARRQLRVGPEPLVISLPEPCLVVLVGAAGSGKSTLAARHFAAGEILSSDGFRALMAGYPTDQSVTRPAFAMLHRELRHRLAAGLTTVVDATNVTAAARRSLLRRAAPFGLPAVAIVLDLEPTLVLARNATRTGRIVPEAAVRGQLHDLTRTLRRNELAREGYASVHHLRTAADLDRLAVRRGEAARPAAPPAPGVNRSRR